MAFTVRIEIQGLFRIKPDDMENPKEIVAVAPWVEPEDRRECRHDFVVQWKPRHLGHEVPGDAETVWRLEGKRLSFDFGRRRRNLNVNLGSLKIPWIHTWKNGTRIKKGIFDPKTHPHAAIKPEAWKPPENFHYEKETVTGLPRRRNKQGVMGQVLVDHGKLVTDDVEAVMTTIKWKDDAGKTRVCEGNFTNRLALIVGSVRKFSLVVEDLVYGGKAILPLAPGGDGEYLQIKVKHICPQYLIHDQSLADASPSELVDKDFKFLYDLSMKPHLLPSERPLPKRSDVHTQSRWDCGSVGG